jgi:hypothetical protein
LLRDDGAPEAIRLGCQGKWPSRLFRKLADRLAAASPSFGSGGQFAVTGEAPVFQKRLVCY